MKGKQRITDLLICLVMCMSLTVSAAQSQTAQTASSDGNTTVTIVDSDGNTADVDGTVVLTASEDTISELKEAAEEAEEAVSAYGETSCGFYKWLAANDGLGLTAAQATDAKIAVNLLDGTVPSAYSDVILNSGNITTTSTTLEIDSFS